MLSCWHDLLSLFCLLLFYLLVVWGWDLWTDRVFSLSHGLACTADSKIIIIIIIIIIIDRESLLYVAIIH